MLTFDIGGARGSSRLGVGGLSATVLVGSAESGIVRGEEEENNSGEALGEKDEIKEDIWV